MTRMVSNFVGRAEAAGGRDDVDAVLHQIPSHAPDLFLIVPLESKNVLTLPIVVIDGNSSFKNRQADQGICAQGLAAQLRQQTPDD